MKWADGGVLIRMSDNAQRVIRGKNLHLQAAINRESELILVCGYAHPIDGYRLLFQNRTTVPADSLPVYCKNQ